MRRLRPGSVVIAIVLAGCGSSSSATCEQVGDHMQAMLSTGARLDDVRAIFVERCTKDEWSAAARTCIASTKATADVAGCRGALGLAAVPLGTAIRDEMQRLSRLSPDSFVAPSGPGVEVSIPKPPPGEPASTESLVIEVTATTTMAGGKPMTDAQLDQVFLAAFARSPSTQIVISAAPGVPHGRVVAIMERAKAAGLTRLAIGSPR